MSESLKKFNAKISYTSTSGLRSSSVYQGPNRHSDVEDAYWAALSEMAHLAAASGLGDQALSLFSTWVHRTQARAAES